MQTKPQAPSAAVPLPAGSAPMHVLGQALNRLTQRQGLVLLGTIVLVFLASAAVSLVTGLPLPKAHDEFSYLLAADTFSLGRLTNPTHPLWPHFESPQILQQPTYASKYPPAQGLFLALGQVVAGQAIVGVWLGAALMVAAMIWMLWVWVPERWALMGGLIAAASWTVATYWSQSYWGGAVAAVGGALLYGSLRRLMTAPKFRHAVVFALGLALLANSRPFEGLLVSLPAIGLLAAWLIRERRQPGLLGLVLAPIVIIMGLTAGAMGYYNARVTGDPLKMPYVAYEATYGVAPLFVWGQPRPEPVYRHEVLREYHAERSLQPYLEQRAPETMVDRTARKLSKFWDFYLGFVLALPLVLLPWALRDRWTRLALLVVLIGLSELLLAVHFFPHYLAPIAALLLVLIVQSLRQLDRLQWRGTRIGRSLVAIVLAMAVILPVVAMVRAGITPAPTAWYAQRATLQAELEASGDRHLVVVRYGPDHHVDQEWVYNAADIDQAPVVWARDMGSANNRRLLNYFQDRQQWLLVIDQDNAPYQLMTYPQ